MTLLAYLAGVLSGLLLALLALFEVLRAGAPWLQAVLWAIAMAAAAGKTPRSADVLAAMRRGVGKVVQ